MVFDRKCMSRKANKQEPEVCLQFMPEKIASNPHRAKWRFCIRAIMKNRTCCSYILSLEFPDCFNLQMIYSYGTPKFRVCYNISLKKPQDNCAIETIVRNFRKRQKYHQRFQVIFFVANESANKRVSFSFVVSLPEFRFLSPNRQLPYGSKSKHCKHKSFASLKAVLALVTFFVGTIALGVNRKKIRKRQFVYTKWIYLCMNKHQKQKNTKHTILQTGILIFAYRVGLCTHGSPVSKRKQAKLHAKKIMEKVMDAAWIWNRNCENQRLIREVQRLEVAAANPNLPKEVNLTGLTKARKGKKVICCICWKYSTLHCCQRC